MKYRASLLLFLLRFPGAPFTLGQEPDPAVPNWPAPATWSPPRSHAGLTMMGEVTNPLPFIGVSPCRILDTRGNGAPIQGGIFTGGSDVRTYSLAGICGIPAEAQAISLNFTVTGPGQTTAGFLTAWPASGPVPPVSILNWDRVPEQIANAAVVPTSSSASIKVNVSAPTHVVVDVNGYYAGSGVGAANTFLGSNAGNFTMTGAGNTAVGSNTFSSNTTGGDNTAVGYYALYVNSAGVGNVAVGYEALRNQTAGTGNVAIGQYAGSSLTSGSSNIFIGNSGFSSESNRIRIGDSSNQFQTYIAGIYGGTIAGDPVVVSSIGQLGRSASSRRFKEEIQDIAKESDGLMRLRPVAFRYRRDLDPDGLRQYGLVAEEVAEVYPELVTCDRDGRPETVRYQLVNVLLLDEVQRQHRTIEAQQDEIAGLKARLTKLETEVSAGK